MKYSISIVMLAAITSVAGAACENAAEAQAGPARDEAAVVTTEQGQAAGGQDDARAAGRQTKRKQGFVQNIDAMTTENRDYRRVVYTGEHLQLVLMAIAPGEHIGEEAHAVDQFFRVEEGSGDVVIDGVRTPFDVDFALIIPAGARHDVINTGERPLKVYTIYAPPQHRPGTVHRTRAEAERAPEHFERKTTE